MTTKVDKFLGGLGIDATNKLEVAANATVTVGNGTATGNVHVGGNMSIGNISPGTHDLAVAGTTNLAALVVPEGQLTLGSTAVTSTATEINLLDAITRGSIIYGNASAATARLAKGGAGTVLTSDGTDIAWAAGSGISSVVADTSPQLGGTLDGNDKDINITTNKKVQFRDAAIFINSSTNGQLDLIADALTKVSGNVTLGTNASNTITITGTLDCGTL